MTVDEARLRLENAELRRRVRDWQGRTIGFFLCYFASLVWIVTR